MLGGRWQQCRVLDGLLAEVRAGYSRVLVVRGEPGIGKTALLGYAARVAADFQVARAEGVGSEIRLASKSVSNGGSSAARTYPASLRRTPGVVRERNWLYGEPRPFVLARTPCNWLRELMASLVKTLCRWYSTVLGLMNSRAAISGLDRPSPASRPIWVSRAVSWAGASVARLRTARRWQTAHARRSRRMPSCRTP